MNSEESVIHDLFAEDKRLKLKAIKDFNKLLADGFGEGPCTCVRCKESSGDETGYLYQHTFTFGGKANRRFTVTTPTDVLSALKAAWLAFTKTELEIGSRLDLHTLGEFVEHRMLERLEPLLRASGVVYDQDGALVVQAVQE